MQLDGGDEGPHLKWLPHLKGMILMQSVINRMPVMRVPVCKFLVGLLAFLVVACVPSSVNGTPQPGFSIFPTQTPLPTARVGITHAPDAQPVVQNFLAALVNGDYATMYGMLSKDSQSNISQDDFSKQYDNALNTMGASKLDFEVLSQHFLNPHAAQVDFRITYHTALVGDLQREMITHLNLEAGAWRLQWDPTLILPELTNGNVLKMDYQVPLRGNIYDQNGQPVVAQSEAYAIGIVPANLGDHENATVDALSRLTGKSTDYIKSLYANVGSDWYVPIGEASPDEIASLNLSGVSITQYNSRFYFKQGIAPQVVGYTQPIPKDEFGGYLRQGYRGDEKVGRAGIEQTMESYLAGKHGGKLYVVDPNGQIVKQLGASDPQPADSVYLTLDRDLQSNVQQIISGFNGAAVVMEVNTGRILAMASSPEYDQNAFDQSNTNSTYLLQDLNNSQNQPLFNRAAQGQYPLGSVFKIITMSAALESGLYLPQTTYDCQYHFTELQEKYGGPVLNDWTWENCQAYQQQGRQCNSASNSPSGLLTLQQGLMRSCDPYFWHIGLDLYENDRAADVANMAKEFGLGSPTGIDVILEGTGQIIVPTTPIEMTNEVIGQGDVLVTPLQVARFVAAVGNGGTLYKPQLIEKIQPASGEPIKVFKPVAAGNLPLRPDNLAALQEAMRRVITDPRGTAYYALLGLSLPMAGKTGTAQTSAAEPDAWFVGYTMDTVSSGKPDIAVAVVVENSGEGADYAAPIYRAIIQSYYYGHPQTNPWFGAFNNPITATPLGVPPNTPKPPKGKKPAPTP